MIYQITTTNNLCNSKMFFFHKKDLLDHIKKVVKETEKYRSKLPSLFQDKLKVIKSEMLDSIRVCKIDVLDLPDWKTVFGPEKPITEPER